MESFSVLNRFWDVRWNELFLFHVKKGKYFTRTLLIIPSRSPCFGNSVLGFVDKNRGLSRVKLNENKKNNDNRGLAAVFTKQSPQSGKFVNKAPVFKKRYPAIKHIPSNVFYQAPGRITLSSG